MGDNSAAALIWPSRNFATESAREIANGHALMPLVEDSFNVLTGESFAARVFACSTAAAGTRFAERDFFLQQL